MIRIQGRSRGKRRMRLQELVAKNIRIHRRRIGLTQQQLCERVSLNVKQLSQLENAGGNITLQTVERLADGLGVHPHELLASDQPGKSDSEVAGVRAAIDVLTQYLEHVTKSRK